MTRVLCVAVVLALVAAPALGASCTPSACTAPSWACNRCTAIADAESQCRCIKYLNLGYQVGALESCAAAQYDNWRAACFDDCVGKLPLGQEWRCSKCAPSTVIDVLYCYVSEGRGQVGADATAACASLALPGSNGGSNYYGRSGYSCTDCLFLAANKIGPNNDWRCLACNVPELLAFSVDGWTDAARKRCYALVAGADPDSKNTVKRVDEVSDVVTCSKIPGATLREQCYSCLQSRTGTGTTWACAQCAGKTAAAAATCLGCLTTTDPANLWQCTNA